MRKILIFDFVGTDIWQIKKTEHNEASRKDARAQRLFLGDFAALLAKKSV